MLNRIIIVKEQYSKPLNHVQTNELCLIQKSHLRTISLRFIFAQLAGAVESTDCFSAEG